MILSKAMAPQRSRYAYLQTPAACPALPHAANAVILNWPALRVQIACLWGALNSAFVSFQEVIFVIAENDIFLTAAETMKILRLKKSTFYSYVAQRIIPSVKIGHFLRFKRADIINFGK